MKYDDASWHYGGDFPSELENDAGATHIGMFVACFLLNDLAGEIHSEEFPEALEQLKKHQKTPGQWFIENCDEKFTDEDLSEEGNKFASFYYASENAPYLDDYEEAIGTELESLYFAPDSWELYERLELLFMKRLKTWKNKNG